MQTLQLIFALLAVYGAVTAQLGAALIALAMAGFMTYAARKFKQQDLLWQQDYKRAQAKPTAEELLIQQEQEAGRSRF